MSDEANDIERRIRERAYRLWQDAGSPEGRDEEFWHRARELEAAGNRPPANSGPNESAIADALEDMEQPGSIPSHSGSI